MKLLSARIQNFKSLEDVRLNFRDLTIIVGANATGKSNCLDALHFLTTIVKAGAPPPEKWLQNFFRNDQENSLGLEINLQEKNKDITYQAFITKNGDSKISFSQEKLTIDDVMVIDNNQVCDEDGRNIQKYQSKEGHLALKTAGDFGNKPLTAQLSAFIRAWQFYDFEPRVMRGTRRTFNINFESGLEDNPRLDMDGEYLDNLLLFYYKNLRDKFDNINQELEACLGISLVISEDPSRLLIKESDGKIVRFSSLSDGTLRIIGYCTLLYKEDLSPLIGIEEPERNLHPALLIRIAVILKKLSQRTQVILTTHSSQLLDCFTTEDLAEDISILLLSKPDDHGTQVFQLEKLRLEQESLADWMENFGIGSAVYHSNLLEGVLQAQYA